jgi:hypothetical protein
MVCDSYYEVIHPILTIQLKKILVLQTHLYIQRSGNQLHVHVSAINRPYVGITRQAIYVLRNIEVRSCNHCCCGKAISITYSKCVFVLLGIQHAMRMRHTVICGLPGSTKFFHLVYKRHDFRKKSYLT